jgi:hypothetical protein
MLARIDTLAGQARLPLLVAFELNHFRGLAKGRTTITPESSFEAIRDSQEAASPMVRDE